jgi:DNA polymerase-4
MDAFYASVEQRDNLKLVGKPVIIGASPGTRGVVSACSYEARVFGVHSAMPISEAVRKCPEGIFLPVRMGRYQEASSAVMEILSHYTPVMRQISVDEACLDMTGTERLFGPPLSAALRLKREVRDKTGLTLSIGIAPNRYLAKLASERDKPDGLWLVEEGKEVEFLDKMPLRSLWGVGKKTLARLTECNIITIKALRRYSLTVLRSMMGDGCGTFLSRHAGNRSRNFS